MKIYAFISCDTVILKEFFSSDTVGHTILLATIDALNSNGQLLNLLTSYLENRTQGVDVDGKFSKRATMKTGIPQVLYPRFAVVFTPCK